MALNDEALEEKAREEETLEEECEDSDDDMVSFHAFETVYEDMSVSTCITLDRTQDLTDPFVSWTVDICVKQPKSAMKFNIDTPFLNTKKEWDEFFLEGKSITFRESTLKKICVLGETLHFLTDTKSMVWSFPKDAITPALKLAVDEAARLLLSFADEDPA